MVLIPRRSRMRMSSGTKKQRDRLERGKRDRLERKHTREYMDMLAIFRKAKVSLA
jgi:hypothetical protein